MTETKSESNCSFSEEEEIYFKGNIIYKNEGRYVGKIQEYEVTEQQPYEPLKMLDNGSIIDDANTICQSLPEFEVIDETFQILPSDYVTRTEDGTVIRVYYYQGEWFTATSKCIDGRNSIFSAKKSFDELFWDTFNKENVEFFDKNSTYFFILKHVNNRLVLKHTRNSILFIKSVDNNTGESFNATTPKNKGWISHVYNQGNLEYELEIRHLNSISPPTIKELSEIPSVVNGRGLLIKRAEKYYMYDNPEYSRVKRLRGNAPDIVYRYIVFLKTNLKKAIELEKEFPEFKNEFIRSRKILYLACDEIYRMYMTREFTARVLKKNDIAFCSEFTCDKIIFTNHCEPFIEKIKQKYGKRILFGQFCREFYYSDNAFLYKFVNRVL
ncbi:MAG: hypothetical protein PHX34_04450 [Candidatus Shapirobacteria bacterium]|nr:hypothetical protein [Candidatus Shapirobacteria bacterium]